jgi:predicted RNase H-like HicB family nuclease
MKKEFLVVFEKGKESVGAHAPDIDGCFAVGQTLEEARRRYVEAAEAHLQWLAKDHDTIPQPVTTTVEFARTPGEQAPTYYVEWLAISVPAKTRHAIPA